MKTYRNFQPTQQPTRGVAIADAADGRPDGGEESPAAGLIRGLLALQNGLYWLDRLDDLQRRGGSPLTIHAD